MTQKKNDDEGEVGENEEARDSPPSMVLGGGILVIGTPILLFGAIMYLRRLRQRGPRYAVLTASEKDWSV